MAGRGIASIHEEYRSMQVRQYSMPSEGGRGPIKSICTTLNLPSGIWYTPNLDLVCLFTLHFWHLMHVLAHSPICFFISGQMNFSVICLMVLFTPG
ncbi:hypothetical protein NPIL_339701 [Nephila pilipes]|uniref:Uncharacterized protein n=1 Tax=Nephila pilipes TaxID=299642 RepID=A0A8X6NJ94_NEPPI|nr:hypothetical protein NPIL_339701 [Nephila pilipes]